MIKIPKVDAFSKPLRRREEIPLTESKKECGAPTTVSVDKHESLKPKLLEAERSAELCGRGSCSNLELDAATLTESQSKNVLPVLSDVGVGLSSLSTKKSWRASRRDFPSCSPKDGSHLLTRLQRARMTILAGLIDPNHVLMCDQFGYSSVATRSTCQKSSLQEVERLKIKPLVVRCH